MTGLHILIPAAGASSRMRGTDKLLEQVDGKPLLARQIHVAAMCNCPIAVTLPDKMHPRAQVLPKGVTLLEVPDSDQGISASLRAGTRWAMDQGASSLMVLLADLPDITAQDLQQIMRGTAENPDMIIRAEDNLNIAGHPVVFPKKYFEKLHALTDDTGAASMLKSAPVKQVTLPGSHATTDLDTPQAWAQWRALNPDR